MSELLAKRAYEALQYRLNWRDAVPWERLDVRTQRAWTEVIEAVTSQSLALGNDGSGCRCASCEAAGAKRKERAERQRETLKPVPQLPPYCECATCQRLATFRRKRADVLKTAGAAR